MSFMITLWKRGANQPYLENLNMYANTEINNLPKTNQALFQEKAGSKPK